MGVSTSGRRATSMVRAALALALWNAYSRPSLRHPSDWCAQGAKPRTREGSKYARPDQEPHSSSPPPWARKRARPH
jgi:hypothetical protein